MYSLMKNKARFFELQTPSGKILHIKPPKLAALRKLDELDDNATIAETSAAVAGLLTSNRENVKVTPEMVEQWMDHDQLIGLMDAFTAWMKGERENDPN